MIIIDKPKLKFLLAGRAITITVRTGDYRKGRIYAVGLAHNRPATCKATIEDIKPLEHGFQLRIVQNREAPERYLARSMARGYTYRPEQAIPDEGATALSLEDLERISSAGRARFEQERSERTSTQTHEERLTDLLARAAAGDRQAQRHLFMIEKHLREAEQRQSRDVA
jgi:hypothetical protein